MLQFAVVGAQFLEALLFGGDALAEALGGGVALGQFHTDIFVQLFERSILRAQGIECLFVTAAQHDGGEQHG